MNFEQVTKLRAWQRLRRLDPGRFTMTAVVVAEVGGAFASVRSKTGRSRGKYAPDKTPLSSPQPILK